MKTSLIAFLMFFSSVTFAAEKEVKIAVNGMVCGFCAHGITKKFKAQRQVASVDVKLSEKQVTLSLKDKEDIPDDTIRELLKDAGYTVEKIERN